MERRATQHVIGAHLTYLRTVKKETNVFSVAVFPAQFEAVLNGFGAHGMAFLAIVYTFLHMLCVIHRVLHG